MPGKRRTVRGYQGPGPLDSTATLRPMSATGANSMLSRLRGAVHLDRFQSVVCQKPREVEHVFKVACAKCWLPRVSVACAGADGDEGGGGDTNASGGHGGGRLDEGRD